MSHPKGGEYAPGNTTTSKAELVESLSHSIKTNVQAYMDARHVGLLIRDVWPTLPIVCCTNDDP